MKRVRVSAALLMAGLVMAGPAAAQPSAPSSSGVTLTAAERTAILPLKQAVDARNWPLAASLVPSARAAVRTDNARYVVARFQLDIAIATQNRAAQNEAISAVLETRRATPAEQLELLRQYAGLAYDAGNLTAAEGALNRAVQLSPNDSESLSMLAQLNRNRSDLNQSLAFFQRAVRAAVTTGRPLPQSRYKAALALAEQQNQRGVALEIARAFIAAYPSPANWRDVLIVFRTVGTVDPAQSLDALRLMRAAGALTGERDYIGYVRALAGVLATEVDAQDFVTGLQQVRLAGEAKAALDQGVAARMLDPQESLVRALITAVNGAASRERTQLTAQIAAARTATAATSVRTTADSLLGAGRHAEAAELYRLALTRTGEDPGLLNTRLGIALALAGQRADADAAFRSVTGPGADLAALWSIWLAQRPA